MNLDSSNKSVTAVALNYFSSLPLVHVNSNTSVHIHEYIYGQFGRPITKKLRLDLRWMQRFGRKTSLVNDSTWILDDINIRIWNGTCFFQTFNEDFSRNDNDTYDLSLASVKKPMCGSPGTGSALVLGKPTEVVTKKNITRRSIIVKNKLINIFYSLKEKGKNN